MCKLSPGPRCAKHTYDAMIASQKHRKSCYSIAEEAAAHYDEILFDGDTSLEQRLEARSLLRKALDSLQKADERLLDARDAYDSTPTGQTRLKDGIANSTDEAEKAHLRKRLEAANEIREKQMTAARLQREADKNMTNLTNEEKEQLEVYQAELNKHADAEAEARKKLSTSTKETARARGAKDASLEDMRYSLSGVESVNTEAHAYIAQAYRNAGVSKELAEHYATDTIAANQNGWQFIGPEEDTSERAPRYHDRSYEVKVKGEGHADYEATKAAREALEDDEVFHELSARAQFAQKTYQRSFEAAYNARHEFHAQENKMRQIAQDYKVHRDALRDATQTCDRYQAMKATKLDVSQTHRVTPKAFVASAYKNSDGSTNAYVMVKYGKGTPYYASVTETGQEEDGRGYVSLNNGTRVYANDISTYDLVVVPPQKGADKLFASTTRND